MSNIYLKYTFGKKWCTQNLDFQNFKISSPDQFLGSSKSIRYHEIFYNFFTQLKNQRTGSKTVVRLFYYFNFKRNYVSKSKSSSFLLNDNINFNKNETESKMENPTHTFWEMNLVLQLTSESRIKSKTVMNWSSHKKKECIFCNVYFVRRKLLFYLNDSVLNKLSKYIYFHISKKNFSSTFIVFF